MYISSEIEILTSFVLSPGVSGEIRTARACRKQRMHVLEGALFVPGATGVWNYCCGKPGVGERKG